MVIQRLFHRAANIIVTPPGRLLPTTEQEHSNEPNEDENPLFF
jgi:hypothetical protein